MFQSGELEPNMAQRLLEGYRAGLDLTIYTFYKELMELNPTAKVLLTVREPHKWFASMKKLREITHTLALRQPYAFLLRMMGLGLLLDFLSGIQAPKMPGVLGKVTRALAAGEKEAVAVFNAHVEEVRHGPCNPGAMHRCEHMSRQRSCWYLMLGRVGHLSAPSSSSLCLPYPSLMSTTTPSLLECSTQSALYAGPFCWWCR